MSGDAITQTVTIAAAILIDDAGRMLVVKKRGSPYFMQPGGKLDGDETPDEALRRELSEEVSLDLVGGTPHGVYSAPAANEPDTTVVAHIFSGRAGAAPRIGREIEALAWVDPEAPGEIVLAPLTRDHMLPLAQKIAAEIAGEVR